MKSGGPWNLRGLRSEAREVARDAARRSGLSVGEWLNGVIRQSDADYGDEMRFADYDDEDGDWGEEARRAPRRAHRGPQKRRRQEYAHDYSQVRDLQVRDLQVRDLEQDTSQQEFGEVHARLDRLTNQLERMARSTPSPMTGAPPRGRAPAPQPRRPSRPAARGGNTSVDDAVAEIAERQRALYGEPVMAAQAPEAYFLPEEPSPAMAPPPAAQPVYAQPAYVPPPPAYAPRAQAAEPQFNVGHLEEQLRTMAARIDALRPTGELGRAIATIHNDLDDIRHQLTEAQPRHVVQSLQDEAQALAQRVDYSRSAGVDAHTIAGIEQGLAEVRDALHGLTPAESLVGFDEAVQTLAQKVDMIIARENPAAIEQLESAIGALHGIVGHVASNDSLNKVAEDIRALAGQIDALAQHTASGHAVSALESRIESLANALGASTDAGHAVPRDLEKLLTGLIEKLEWVQLTHTDQAAMGSLEDRIAQLVKRLDASDAKLGNLAAVERGLADLLVHLDQVRGGSVAEIKRSEQRTQDTLEAVHGTVEQVVDRLAHIENGIHGVALQNAPAAATPLSAIVVSPASGPAAPVEAQTQFEPQDQTHAAASEADFNRPLTASRPAFEPSAAATPGAPPPIRPDTGAPRKPIDPNLPPDHPLEPGTTNGQRSGPSAAERIAASEAAAGYGKPPVTGEAPDKTNFVAAARRAAQAAAAAAPEKAPRTTIEGLKDDKKTPRLRKLLVAGGALLVVYGGVRVATHMVADSGPAVPPPAMQQIAPPAVLPESDANKQTSPSSGSGPLVLPVPGANDTPPKATPGAPLSIAPQAVPPAPAPAAAPPPAAPAPAAAPSRQSAIQIPGDITGSLSRQISAPSAVPQAPPITIAPAQASSPALSIEKLPATIGGPALRAAALAGDAAAEFEVATRYIEGHGVPPSNDQAARWLERAAKQGLAVAQFRLGGFYEKGIGVKKDLAVARDYYKAAADKGNGKAMHNLAVLYAEGINGPSDYRSAARWFRAAADHGIADSQYNLAILYARGVGVEQNYAESYKWFLLAANQGDNEAAKKRDDVAQHLDAQSLAAAQAAVQKWTPASQPEEAVNVKTPPGGWDPQPQPAAKSKVRVIGAK